MPAELTFAVPFYRGQQFLRGAVGSALRQTCAAWRLIVVDDAGPEPGTEELVRGFGDRRVSYVRNPSNLGMAANWNRCLDLADTGLVTLLHADDELRPEYAERALAAAARDPGAAAYFCGADIIGPDGRAAFSLADAVKWFLWPHRRRPSVVAGRRALEALCLGNFLMCPTACYRKSVLGGRRFDARWRFVLDLEFFTRLLMDGEHFVLDPRRSYAYRRHPGNATEAYTASSVRFDEEVALYELLARSLQRRGWEKAAWRARARVFVRLNAAHRFVGDVWHGQLARAASRLRVLCE